MRSGHGPKLKVRMSELSKVIYGQKSVEELTGMMFCYPFYAVLFISCLDFIGKYYSYLRWLCRCQCGVGGSVTSVCLFVCLHSKRTIA